MENYVSQVNRAVSKMTKRLSSYAIQLESQEPIEEREDAFLSEWKDYQLRYGSNPIETVNTKEEHMVWLFLWIDLVEDFDGEEDLTPDIASTNLYAIEQLLDVAHGERESGRHRVWADKVRK